MTRNILTRRTDGNISSIKSLYDTHHEEFLRFTRRYTEDLDLRYDAYQEALVAFYEYSSEGHFDISRSSPKTMIFNMGKYYLINRLKKESKILYQDDLEEKSKHNLIMEDYLSFTLDENQTIIKKAINKLGDKCRDIIVSFYYHSCSLETIKDEMNYNSLNVVSSHKSRCIKKLRSILKALYGYNG